MLAPTAPPRMFKVFGFEDTLLSFGSLNHGQGLIELASNPYAAMPSIHAADALIVGITMALIVKSRWVKALWLAWPAWVWFSVMATANHFWLDIAAGVLVALIAGAIVYRRPLRRALRRTEASAGVSEQQPAPGDGGPDARVGELDRVKQEYTRAAREILQRSMRGVAKTKLTPDMLTLAGVTLCLAGAVLVGFEQRNEYLYFWLGGVLFVIGSIADILDGALARAASKGTVFGAFLDSSFDRVGEAAMLAAIGLSFMHDGNEVALVAAFAAVIGSFLVSYTRAKAESLGLRADVGFGSRVERVVLISIGLGLAPWGLLQWPIYALAAVAWLTVVQRILFVRRQLRELAEAP